jgi:hypothetical protein
MGEIGDISANWPDTLKKDRLKAQTEIINIGGSGKVCISFLND